MITIGQGELSLQEVEQVANGEKVSVSPEAWKRVEASRKVIEDILAKGQTVYGVNTGFGRLSDITIKPEDLSKLQVNLVRSHAVGVGEPLSISETRAMMFLRASVLAAGFSGARKEPLELLVEMLNKNVVPVVPSKGSVGASGDLAPLAHLAMALIGEGECWDGNGRISGSEALQKAGLNPLDLKAKEGLALLNGTQAIGAVGSFALARAYRSLRVANIAGAMSLEALLGTPAAFDSRIHSGRPHSGQIKVAEELRDLLEGSEIRESHREGDSRVQDAYCLRCMPQVHGSVFDALEYAREKLKIESSSATDNPLVFAQEGEVISGGNFHGAPLAHALDFCAIVMTDLLSISERRLDRLVNPDSSEGLPAFLAPEAGLSSGLMMAHVTVAALLNECKVLAHPASTDSVPTSGGKEDHVSMGMTSALKFKRIVENVELGLAIELIAGTEGIDYRRPLKTSEKLEVIHTKVRKRVAQLKEDRSLTAEIEVLAECIRSGELQ